jgi:hypothetical protein
MARPNIEFQSDKDELNYGVKVLLEAGFTPKQIDRIRNEAGVGPGKIPYDKETLGQRRFMVSELCAAQLSNRQIANVLALSKDTVNADRNYNRQLYTEEILKSADVHRARLLKEQMELKETAMRSFEDSKKKRSTTISDKEGDGGAIVRIDESAGDSSFLTVAKNCLVEQARLLGLHELKRDDNQDKTYRQFLTDLTSTIAKEKEIGKEQDARDGAISIDFTDEERRMLPIPEEEPKLS